MKIPDYLNPRDKSLGLQSLVADFNDTKIQKYMSFVNFLVMPDKMTVFPYVDTSLTQFYYMNCSVVKSNDTSVIAALQTAKPPLYPQLLLPSTSITLQDRVTEFYILPIRQVQGISPKQELEVIRNHASTENTCLSTSFVLAIQSIALGFLETLKKTLEFKLDFSCECERSRVKLDLKTQVKCN